MTKIVAIDFETANNQMSSVCSVGIAVMEDGVVIDHYYSLIKPEENVSYFSPYNIRVHGITAKDVEDAPTFSEIYRELTGYFEDAVIVAHNARFHRMGVLREMAEKLGHKVLPLAPYSPELNPIEKVWANIKRYLRTVLSDYARFDDALLSYFDFN